eukprot:Lithocolla_globosa_v1_NODE_5185_length_1287_cov_3.306818.p2 type:complete len:127 gc:universal NODE_5185_length_1287_cov_3.306818:667-1047(+)
MTMSCLELMCGQKIFSPIVVVRRCFSRGLFLIATKVVPQPGSETGTVTKAAMSQNVTMTMVTVWENLPKNMAITAMDKVPHNLIDKNIASLPVPTAGLEISIVIVLAMSRSAVSMGLTVGLIFGGK